MMAGMTHEAVHAATRQDLTTSLLDAAVSASHTAHVLTTAITSPTLDSPTAVADLQAALHLISKVRDELIRCADILASPS
jgi:hypothetical protein